MNATSARYGCCGNPEASSVEPTADETVALVALASGTGVKTLAPKALGIIDIEAPSLVVPVVLVLGYLLLTRGRR